MAVRVVFVRSKSPAGLEPRIAKEAGTLSRSGFEVHVILWDRELAHPAEEDRAGLRIHRFRLRAPEGQPALAWLLPRWWAHVFFRILRLRPAVVHAVDFDTVVPAFAAARIAGARLVYDILDFEAELANAIESSHAAIFLGTISYDEVLDQTAGCQVVAALYDPAVPNNRFAAPNKLFEAMMFEKPVLVSEGTLAADIVREVGCGIVVPYGDREALKRALEKLMLSSEEASAMGARGRAAFEQRYNWKAMEPILLRLYRELLPASAAA